MKIGILLALGFCPLLLHILLAVGGSADHAATPGMVRLVDDSLIRATAAPYAIIYLALLAIFGASLLPRRVAFITALARRMYGAMSADMAAYTRSVTWAWCCFFAAQLLVALLLYVFAPLVVWSLFVNVLNWPLVAAMFAAEHTYRMVHVRDAPRHSLADIVRMIGHFKDNVTKQASSG